MDWFAAVMTLIGVLVGVGIQEFRIWRERKEKYKDMVFEKRLDAHQEGYYRVMRLCLAMLPNEIMKEGGSKVAVERLQEAEEWRDKNALYLTEDTMEKIDDLLEYAADTGCKYANEAERKNISIEEETQKVLRNAGIVSASIKKGVGVKHLPKNDVLGVRILERKSLDEHVGEVIELVKKRMK